VRSEGFYVNEKSAETSWDYFFEPTTFRFVAQHLNHCATAVPFAHFDVSKYVCPINLVSKWEYDFPSKIISHFYTREYIKNIQDIPLKICIVSANA